MEQEKIDRINALSKKSGTPSGLTPDELAEQSRLRAEYVSAIRKNLKSMLDNIKTVDETEAHE